MALLSIRKLHKQYGSVTAIQSLDLDLEKGEVIVLLGPSGCGKSTLLRCVNGLEPFPGKPPGKKSAWSFKAMNCLPI